MTNPIRGLRSHGQSARVHLPLWLVVCLVSGIAVVLLWTEHHSVLPYLLLLACPLLHLFLHRREPHGSHRHPAARAPDERPRWRAQ